MRRVWARLARLAPETYLVGGSVRDLLLGRPVRDWDLATAAPPPAVSSWFDRVIPTGIEHGTVTVMEGPLAVEVTTFRTEGPYADGRRPSRVRFDAGLAEDLGRRDFAINAMALGLDPRDGPGWLRDPYGGWRDLARRRIRTVGPPEQRMAEDHLRILRGYRLAAELGFQLEEETRQAAARAASRLGAVSAERIRDELERILLSPGVAPACQAMLHDGVLAVILPELAAGAGFEQNEYHPYDVFTHSVLACANVPAQPHLRWAALLHDAGKPTTLSVDRQGRRHFFGHEAASAEIAARVLARLRYDQDTIRRVEHLVRVHMDLHELPPDAGDAAVRRAAARVGREHLGDLLRLRRADRIAAGKRGPASPGTLRLLERLARLEGSKAALAVRDLAIDGHQVMDATGLGPGPAVGEVLRRLLDAVLEDPGLNNPADLERLARQYAPAGEEHRPGR